MFQSKARILGACFLCVHAALAAQDCHLALRGRIVESDTKEPLAFASVYVKEANRGAVSDENGHYFVPNLCEGASYTVEISHVECAHFTQVVRLTENNETNFSLVHHAVLREILVTEKSVAPAHTQAESVVRPEDLEATKGVNLGETLKRLPGVTTLNTGATIAKPVIQGLHSNRIAIVTNNVALEGQQWGSEHAPEIDPFASEKITVVKGAAGIRYGVGAMAGAVVLEPAPLRAQEGIGGWLSLGGASNGRGVLASGAVDWHLPGKSLTFRLQGTAKRSGNLRAPDYWLGNTGLTELNISAMAGWKTSRWTHEISGYRFQQKIGILRASHIGNADDLRKAIASDTPLNNLDAFSYHLFRPHQAIEHTLLKVRSTYRLSEKWKLSGQYAFQFNDRREYDVVRKSSSLNDNPQASFRIWTNMLDLAVEHFPIRHWEGGLGVQAFQQLNLVGKAGFVPDYRTFGGSVWAMERWRRYPNPWEFEAGARYDYRSSTVTTSGSLNNLDTLVHFGNASAAAGVIYHFSKNLRITANSGFAWRPPHVNELFARGVHHGTATFEQGRADLQAEKAWNTNLNLIWERQNADASLTIYRNQIGNFIYLDPQNTLVQTVRGAFPAYFYAQADAILQGLDASLSWPIAKGFSLEARASLLRGFRFARDSGEHTRHHDWLPLMPADRYQYGLKWTFGGDKTKNKAAQAESGNGSFVRLMATTALRQTRIPEAGLPKAAPAAFTTLSLDAAHRFQIKNLPLEAGLSVQNLNNARYREYLNFFRFFTDEPGLNLALRAKVTF